MGLDEKCKLRKRHREVGNPKRSSAFNAAYRSVASKDIGTLCRKSECASVSCLRSQHVLPSHSPVSIESLVILQLAHGLSTVCVAHTIGTKRALEISWP